MHHFGLIAIALAALVACGAPKAAEGNAAPPGGTQAAERNDIVQIEEDDPQMTAAIASARTGLPDFYARLANPGQGEDGFGVKFNLDNSGEMIWAGELVRENGQLTGVLNNVPMHPDFRQGQRVPIAEAAIVDWGYVRAGVYQGHHTTRVLIDRMPPADAAALRAHLGW